MDPDGRIILAINEKFNMSVKPLGDKKVGNSKSVKFREAGCYVTTFANIFASSEYYKVPLKNSDKYNTPEKINNDKTLFAENSEALNGRTNSMNALFGEKKWDYWTKEKQGIVGLKEKIDEYAKSGKAYIIVGIFDLSSDTSCASNHMVVFQKDLMIMLITLKNLKEIRVIFLEE